MMFLGFLVFVVIAICAFFVLIFLASFVPAWIAWETRDMWLTRKRKKAGLPVED